MPDLTRACYGTQIESRWKFAIITGASSGIGRASALAFARGGATTVLAPRSAEKLGRVAEEILQVGHEALDVLASELEAWALQELNELERLLRTMAR